MGSPRPVKELGWQWHYMAATNIPGAVILVSMSRGARATGAHAPGAQQRAANVIVARLPVREAARAGLESLLRFMALLSVNLAILNLLPIPVLDGGHLVFLGIEAVRGRPISLEQRVRLTKVGFFDASAPLRNSSASVLAVATSFFASATVVIL